MYEQQQQHKRSLADPVGFWKEQSQRVAWFQEPKTIFRQDRNQYTWFPDGTMNVCYNAIDVHLQEHRDSTALIYDSPVTGVKKQFTFGQLSDEVNALATLLRSRFSVSKGDTVIIYMPMIPEAVFSMLACARLGAIHSVVFGGFAADELAKRVKDATPKLILTASVGVEPKRLIGYLPLVEKALKSCELNEIAVLALDRGIGNCSMPDSFYNWNRELESIKQRKDCYVKPEEMLSTDPLYLIYTSGSTGT